MLVIQNVDASKLHGEELLPTEKSITMLHLSIKNSLRKLLELKGLFSALISYMEVVKREKNVLMNFIQGQL